MATELAAGTKCYIPDEQQVWLAATVVKHDTGKNIVDVKVTELNEKRQVDLNDKKTIAHLKQSAKGDDTVTLPIQNEDKGKEGVKDMILLNYLHEPAILFNLKKRFLGGNPYTYTGNITIAVNPYQWLPELYSGERHERYWNEDRDTLPPHVYATSIASFNHMIQEEKNQSILVSGESGAGKTETTKILMNHLATIAGGMNNKTISRIVEVTPLLESFGNAKTVRNDNSSRFGKFTQLQFNARRTLVGAKCQTYLLEKTRVIGHEEGERNYHIFYQLIDSSEGERKTLQLSNKKEYKYIGVNHHDKIEGKSDAEHFKETKKALGLIGLSDSDQMKLFQLLAGILNLGEIDCQPKASNDEESELTNSPHVKSVCALFNVKEEALETALCSRTMRARTDVYCVPLKADQARDCRDALAKSLYSKAFDWLVSKINLSLADDENMKNHIGVLDIFGFEHFKHNSFEQFCINYANEKLQQKFTQDVFKTVQIEYEEEGISWSHITFSDNQDVLDVIESKMGIISLLNEELMRPKGNEEGFVGKVATLHKEDSAHVIEFPKRSRTQFMIKHYAAPVTYESLGFLEKHKDALLPDLSALMRSSSEPFVSELFPVEKEKASAGGRRRGGNSLKTATLGTQFKQSLAELMENIQATNVYYVRCIKPNPVKSPKEMDQAMVVSQLRCAGVIEAIRISRTAYPNRLLHDEFVNRFWIFATQYRKLSPEKISVKICEKFKLTSPEEYQLGLTRIYFQLGVLEKLNAEKAHVLAKYAIVIQRRVAGYATRMKYLKQRRALVEIQALFRCFLAINEYQRVRHLVIFTQRSWRGKKGRNQYSQLRQERKATAIQALYRGYATRCRFHEKRNHIRKVQEKAKADKKQKEKEAELAEQKKEKERKAKLDELQNRLKQEQKKNKEAQKSGKKLKHSDTVVDVEVMEDAGGMIGTLQEDNAELRAQLRIYKASTEELKERSENLRSDREVLIASNHLKTYNFEKKIKEQEKQLEVTTKEYEALRDFIATHMPEADLLKQSKVKPKPLSGFAYFRSLAKRKADEATEVLNDEEKGAEVMKNIENQFDETSRFLKASAQRVSRAKFWQPVTSAVSNSSFEGGEKKILTVQDAFQSVKTGSFFKAFGKALSKPTSITADTDVGESVSLDNLPSDRKSYISKKKKNAAKSA